VTANQARYLNDELANAIETAYESQDESQPQIVVTLGKGTLAEIIECHPDPEARRVASLFATTGEVRGGVVGIGGRVEKSVALGTALSLSSYAFDLIISGTVGQYAAPADVGGDARELHRAVIHHPGTLEAKRRLSQMGISSDALERLPI
jgi:hypothetical protein